MKTLTLAVLAFVAMPALAHAQEAPGSGAAATLPNAFDQPAQAGAARPAPVAGPTAARAPDVARSEEALRAVIAAAQAGTIDYSVFSDNLAEQIRAQAPQLTPLIQQFGAVRTVEHKGQENGADMFLVTFEKQATDWIIGFDDDNQIAALLFRPSATD